MLGPAALLPFRSRGDRDRFAAQAGENLSGDDLPAVSAGIASAPISPTSEGRETARASAEKTI